MALTAPLRTLELSRPNRTLLLMLAFLVLVGVIVFFLFTPIRTVFEANIYLNLLILAVFVIGVIYTFWQVLRLFRCVDWMQAFLEERSGFDSLKAPGLMTSAAALLRDKDWKQRLTTNTSRTILDSVAIRLDESREIVRYIGALLIFLGLLGTFWGLSLTIPAVVETIRALAPSDDAQVNVFQRLMTGLEGQLGGMGTAFASSLLGLAGSLIVGFLEILAGHAQNRYYRELEEALSLMTNIGRGESELGYLGGLLEQNNERMTVLLDALGRHEHNSSEQARYLGQAAGDLSQSSEVMRGSHTVMTQLVATQEQLKDIMAEAVERNKGVIGGMDEATRQHIRNLDTRFATLAEEMAEGRQSMVTELRNELQLLTRTISSLAGKGQG